MEQQKLKFEFTIEEANAILGAIGQMPYAQVAGLVDNIKQQAAPQVQQQAPQEVIPAGEQLGLGNFSPISDAQLRSDF